MSHADRDWRRRGEREKKKRKEIEKILSNMNILYLKDIVLNY